VGLVTFDRQAVSAQEDRAAKAIAKRAENAVADRGELGRDFVRNGENLLHRASV
jgi:hypothetical protein